jgi:hypothetical protein
MKKVLRAVFGPPSPRLLQEVGLDPLEDPSRQGDQPEPE